MQVRSGEYQLSGKSKVSQACMCCAADGMYRLSACHKLHPSCIVIWLTVRASVYQLPRYRKFDLVYQLVRTHVKSSVYQLSGGCKLDPWFFSSVQLEQVRSDMFQLAGTQKLDLAVQLVQCFPFCTPPQVSVFCLFVFSPFKLCP